MNAAEHNSSNEGCDQLFVHDLFHRAQNIHPQLIAVQWGSMGLTYRELNEQSDALAAVITSSCLQARFVGVSTTRNMDMIIFVLAVLKAGKAYLPLDPAYPEQRLRQMTEDSGLVICLATDREKDFFEALGLRVLSNTGEIAVPDGAPAHHPSTAYLLYTSGSTGKPKGVCMGHAALVNLLQWQQQHSAATTGTHTLQFAPLGFDVSFQEIFSTLTTGGTLFLVEDDFRLDPHRLLQFIEEHRINRLFLPFVALQQLAAAAGAHNLYPSCLQEIMTAGEQLKCTPRIIDFFSAIPACVFYNQYGPTETHVVTQLKLAGNRAHWDPLPSIGSAISNAQIFILDAQLNVTAPGSSGELCVGGICLAEGYLNDSLRTEEKFVSWQHPLRGTMRIYRTGDTARFLPDGTIAYLGRGDEQVKIRGYRVEPGEIEVLLTGIEGIQGAVVAVKEDGDSQKLVAYLVAAGGEQDTVAVRSSLQKALPPYAIPSAFVWLDKFPKTGSGKVDKRALPDPELKRPPLSVSYVAPGTAIEKDLAAIWAPLLSIDKVGTEDNFFELGGNSLLAVKSVAELMRLHNLYLPLTKLYRYPTIKGLAAYFGQADDIGPKNKIKKEKTRGGDVAVIGMAGRFPGADTIEELWSLLKEGKETIRLFTDSDLDISIPAAERNHPAYVKARGVITDADRFDAAFFGINPSVARLMDPQQRIFLEVAWEVLEKTGYLPGDEEVTVGVFAGCGNNSYYINNVLPNREMIDKVGAFQVMTVNEKDYIATRTAYELDLKGPAVSVNTGCSTSLLAIAQAVDGIRNGRCDIALAGGVAVTAPINSGYFYEEGAMFSPDGHCRPFDADGQGTVFSDGAGAVLLKDFDAAVRDGDTVYAVIKGAGYNNDGREKGSFTAPSAQGQADAILLALEDAALQPADLSYIEAHGTATPLGDPIEIEGLNIAFGTQRGTQLCALGSIKSNMGHLTAAAGVGGFIKTVLCLYHKQLVPSLHYKQPNPNINFAPSPFYVNTEWKAWESSSKRRAGVSSFGVGGTNVHLVLEEAGLVTAPSEPEKAETLLCWSAKNDLSLHTYAKKLSRFLGGEEHINLADVAYTLHTTRRHFANRTYVTGATKAELIKKLNEFGAAPAKAQAAGENNRDVVFMFPGQGAQYVNMGKDLYEVEPVFRQAVDECAGLLQTETGGDIRAAMYPADTVSATDINDTRLAQPALFILEYALAKLWMSWGLQPVAFVGHSLGEFVAAHLSGIFSLPDALKIIAFRGRLMSTMPGGSMASVRIEAAKIEATLPAGLSLAAINGPAACVVSGPGDILSAYMRELATEGIASRLLHTSHAFHSAMMDPVITPFSDFLEGIDLRVPQIPVLSTVTGDWLTDGEATSKSYWANHLRVTVRFAAAVEKLTVTDNPVLLEVGPGTALANLARQQSGATSSIIAGIGPGTNGQSEYSSFLAAAGQLWQQGIAPGWKALYKGQKRARLLNLPTYAFDKKLCWVHPVQGNPQQENNRLTMVEAEPAQNSDLTVQTTNMRRNIIVNKVKAILEEASGISMENVPSNANFIHIGLDSLLLTQVALTLKKEFRIPVTFRQLNESCSNVYALSRYVDEQLPPDNHLPEFKTVTPVEVSVLPTASEGSITMPPVNGVDGTDTALGLMAQQIQLLAKQIALLQGSTPSSPVAPPLLKEEHKTGAQTAAPLVLTAEEAAEIKKPFGAAARIERHTTEVTGLQKIFLAQLIKKYNGKTAKSKEYNQQHRSFMADPRVVTGFRPLTKELVYSLVINRSKGNRLWDVDGNEYIDVLNGFGSNLFGYQPEAITKALQEQIEKGYEIGPQHELAGTVCRLICEFTHFDRAALCNTGSEAVLGALRIARTVTGRSLVVSFTGSYHGINDEVIVRGTKKGISLPAAPGIMREAVANMLVLDYGSEESLKIIRERAHELAAVLVEPVQSRRPEFQPFSFLKELRTITQESDTALIFDEVITGFRVHPNGVQGLTGIQADLATYGKVVGGGLPIGVIAGKQEYMDALDGGFWQYGDHSVPEAGVTYFAGTFVRHPLSLAASKASLEYMKAKGPQLQLELTKKTGVLAMGLNAMCEGRGLPLHIVHFGSLWKIKFKEDVLLGELLFTLMRSKGIHIWDMFPCFMTEAFTEKDIQTVIGAFDESVSELTAAAIFAPPAGVATVPKEEALPPYPGARLGKDASGKEAWFVQDPQRPGKYLQVNSFV